MLVYHADTEIPKSNNVRANDLGKWALQRVGSFAIGVGNEDADSSPSAAFSVLFSVTFVPSVVHFPFFLLSFPPFSCILNW